MASIKAFSKAEGTMVQVDLDDETGQRSNGRTYEVMEVTVGEDGKAIGRHPVVVNTPSRCSSTDRTRHS